MIPHPHVTRAKRAQANYTNEFPLPANIWQRSPRCGWGRHVSWEGSRNFKTVKKSPDSVQSAILGNIFKKVWAFLGSFWFGGSTFAVLSYNSLSHKICVFCVQFDQPAKSNEHYTYRNMSEDCYTRKDHSDTKQLSQLSMAHDLRSNRRSRVSNVLVHGGYCSTSCTFFGFF